MKTKLTYTQVSERLRQGYFIHQACSRAAGLLSRTREKSTFTSLRKLIAEAEVEIAHAKELMDECEQRQGGITD